MCKIRQVNALWKGVDIVPGSGVGKGVHVGSHCRVSQQKSITDLHYGMHAVGAPPQLQVMDMLKLCCAVLADLLAPRRRAAQACVQQMEVDEERFFQR